MPTITTNCGEKLMVVLPDECADQLGWTAGDVLGISVEDEALKIIRIQTAHDRAIEIARKGMVKYRAVLEALAKS